jgi:hypothetical protein
MGIQFNRAPLDLIKPTQNRLPGRRSLMFWGGFNCHKIS